MRDHDAAAEVVSKMPDDAIQLFAKHDPDIFRDVAKAYLALLDYMNGSKIDRVMGDSDERFYLSFLELRKALTRIAELEAELEKRQL